MNGITLDLFSALPEERGGRGLQRPIPASRRDRPGGLRRDGRGRPAGRERGHRVAVPGGEDAPGMTSVDGGLTLDALMLGVWDGLASDAIVECPVCAGSMAPRQSAGAGVVGGRCSHCASTLA
jgi:hypothetical protein